MSDLDLDAIRADVAGARALWDDRDADLYGLLAEAGRLIEHGRTLVAEVERLRGQAAGWMEEATRQAAERDKNYVQLADARHELDVLRGINVDLQQRLDLALSSPNTPTHRKEPAVTKDDLLNALEKYLKDHEDVESAGRVDGEDAIGVETHDGDEFFVEVQLA